MVPFHVTSLDLCIPFKCCKRTVSFLIVSLRNRTAGRRRRRTLVCDKRDRAFTYVFCRDLHLTSMFSGLLQKDLFKGRWILAKSFFQAKLLSRLSHKVCRLLSSPVLLRKFTNIRREGASPRKTVVQSSCQYYVYMNKSLNKGVFLSP